MRVVRVLSVYSAEESEHVAWWMIFGSRFRARIFQEHYDAVGFFMLIKTINGSLGLPGGVSTLHSAGSKSQ